MQRPSNAPPAHCGVNGGILLSSHGACDVDADAGKQVTKRGKREEASIAGSSANGGSATCGLDGLDGLNDLDGLDDVMGGSKGSHGNRILKGLLNQDDEEEAEPTDESSCGGGSGNRFPLAGRGVTTGPALVHHHTEKQLKNSGGTSSSGSISITTATTTSSTMTPNNSSSSTSSNVNCNNNSSNSGMPGSGGNNMLHKLLNLRSDDAEERIGLRKPNELLKKLLKDSDEDPEHQHCGGSGSGNSSSSCGTNTNSTTGSGSNSNSSCGSSSSGGGCANSNTNNTTNTSTSNNNVNNSNCNSNQQHMQFDPGAATAAAFQDEQLLKSLGFPSPSPNSSSSASSSSAAHHPPGTLLSKSPIGKRARPRFFFCVCNLPVLVVLLLLVYFFFYNLFLYTSFVSCAIGTSLSCDGLLEFGSNGSNAGNSGMRGTKRHIDDSHDDVKPSKEPMLSADHLMMTENPSGGTGGVLHQLLGPPVAQSSLSSALHPLVSHHSAPSSLPIVPLQQHQSLPSSHAHSLSSSLASTTCNTGVGIAPSSAAPVPVAGAPGTVTVTASASPHPSVAAATAGVGNGPPSSKLCEKNKMLASLLAKTPMQSSLSTSVASPKPSALPQEKLPKDLKVRFSSSYFYSSFLFLVF